MQAPWLLSVPRGSWGRSVWCGCRGGPCVLFLPVAKLCAAGAWHFSRMWQELLTNTCFPAPSPGMPWGPAGAAVPEGGQQGHPSVGSPPLGLSCPMAAAGGFGALCASPRCGCLCRAAETCPCPGEGTPVSLSPSAHTQPVLLVPWVLSRLPGKGWGAGGTPWGGGVRRARTHTRRAIQGLFLLMRKMCRA